ncbi:MAG: PKD domain-containing protein [Cytophagales bacterium]|nr:PKD domain-containing protein [Cytophagales bacterium]
MIWSRKLFNVLVFLALILGYSRASGQCGGTLEPGFAFLTSSRGCAPFTVSIQTIYLSSVPGTQYFVRWGDGTPEQTYVQAGPTGVTMTHTYPLASVACGYDIIIDASNACNPRGSVVPINTQVIVWTSDVVSVNPATFRVCAGFAANLQFRDNSTWNCFPRATRENNEPRWIQWLYGTGPAGNQIPGMQVNGLSPGAYPYLDPAPGRNPRYPVVAPGQMSLLVNIPVTTTAEIGKEFVVTLKNWNQCNPYDNNLADGNAFNPVGGDLVNGDNPARVTTARVVIVAAPQPNYVTRLGSAGGPVQTVFCINDLIYFANNTPPIGGASFQYQWRFFDNPTGAGVPLGTSTSTNPTFSYASSGQKLIRLSVTDANAAGGCTAVYDAVITISPSLVARISTTDNSNIPIVPQFCQAASPPTSNFQVRFYDSSVGTVIPSTQWRWEFYNESNVLVFEAPAAGAFSSSPLGPFDRFFTNRGIYRTRLIVRDNVTSCQTVDEVRTYVYEKPVPQFTATRVCQGNATSFVGNSTLNAINGEAIVMREWDFNYDGVTFTKDPAFDNQSTFTRSLGGPGSYAVALRVTTNQNACSDILVQTVVVDPLPNAMFTPSVTSGCSVLRVTYTNTSVGGQPDITDRFEWEEDSGAGFVLVGTQRVSDPGFTNQFVRAYSNTTPANRTLSIRMRAVTVNGCSRVSLPVTITIFPGTNAGFSSTNYSPFNDNCSPVSVNFAVDAATQSLNPIDYRWMVSDPSGPLSDVSTGTTPNYSYVFSNSTVLIRDFSVRLTATLSGGCSGDSTRIIRVSPVPVSSFRIDTLLFNCVKMRVRLTASQKGLTYHWVIAENGVTMINTTGTSDVLEYEVNRSTMDINLSIRLDTRNFANCLSLVTTQSIVVPKRDVINAGFTASPLNQPLPASTVFITNTTSPGPWSYSWDFGDGTTSSSSSANLQHTYATYGTYVITLRVINNVCMEEQTETIVIQAIPPVIDFSYDLASGCAPLTVNFTNLSRYAESNTYVWRFGDGQATSNAVNPSYTYFEAGTYTVSLSGSNTTNQVVTETKTMIINVYRKPKAQFEVKPTLLYIPGGVLYARNNSFYAGRFLWDFGDGSTSDLTEPTHVYAAVGTYDISLIAISPDNCTDTARVKKAVQVQNGGTILVPNAFSPATSGPSGGLGGGVGTKNDVFIPIMIGVTQFEMLVFNRWGELMFRSNDPQIGWDGYYQGNLCAQDVYMYKITALYDSGQNIVRTGDINLIR